MKKSTFSTMFVIAVIGVFLFVNIFLYMIIGNTFKWKYKVENFEKYVVNFNTVNNLVLNSVLQNNEVPTDNRYLFSIGYQPAEEKYTLFYDGIECYISKEIQPMFNEICVSAFNKNLDSNLEWIWYSDGIISYEIGNGKYALVYSTEKDAIYEKYSLQSKDVSIKKCYDNWYHVSIDKNS